MCETAVGLGGKTSFADLGLLMLSDSIWGLWFLFNKSFIFLPVLSIVSCFLWTSFHLCGVFCGTSLLSDTSRLSWLLYLQSQSYY